MPVVIGIIVFLLIVGSVIAIAWWKISARAAPYSDEADRQNAARRRKQQEIEDSTFVIGDDGEVAPVRSRAGMAGAGLAGGAIGAAATHGMGSSSLDPATTPVERADSQAESADGTLYSGPDHETTGFGGGGSSHDGGGMDSGGSSGGGDSYA